MYSSRVCEFRESDSNSATPVEGAGPSEGPSRGSDLISQASAGSNRLSPPLNGAEAPRHLTTSSKHRAKIKSARKSCSIVYCLANVTSAVNMQAVATSSPCPHVILGQEVRVGKPSCQSLINRLKFENDLTAHVHPAATTEAGGLSGGVAIVSAPHFSTLYPQPTRSSGRLNHLVKGRFLECMMGYYGTVHLT